MSLTDLVAIAAIGLLPLLVGYLWFCRDIIDRGRQATFMALFALTGLPIWIVLALAATTGFQGGGGILIGLWLFPMFVLGTIIKHFLVRPRSKARNPRSR